MITKTHVVLPGNMFQGHWVNVLVEDKRNGDDEVEDIEAFRT